MDTRISTNPRPQSNVEDLESIEAPMAVDSLESTDFKEPEQDEFELFQPSFYSQFSESEADLQTPTETSLEGPQTVSSLAFREPEPTQLPSSIQALISDPTLKPEQYSDGKPTIDTYTETALGKMDSAELKGAVENQYAFESSAQQAFVDRGDFSSQQADDAAHALMGKVRTANVARPGQEVQTRINEGVAAQQAELQDHLLSDDARGDIYRLATENRGADLEPALEQWGLDHRTAPALAENLNGLTVGELESLRRGDEGGETYLGLGTPKFVAIENDYREGLQTSDNQLDLVDNRADHAQMKGRIFNEPVFKNVAGDVQAQQTGRSADDLDAHIHDEAKGIDSENRVKSVIQKLSSTSTVGKLVWGATDAGLARSEADISHQAEGLGFTGAETTAEAD